MSYLSSLLVERWATAWIQKRYRGQSADVDGHCVYKGRRGDGAFFFFFFFFFFALPPYTLPRLYFLRASYDEYTQRPASYIHTLLEHGDLDSNVGREDSNPHSDRFSRPTADQSNAVAKTKRAT